MVPDTRNIIAAKPEMMEFMKMSWEVLDEEAEDEETELTEHQQSIIMSRL